MKDKNYLSSIEFARKLRQELTDSEQLMWYLLRNRRLLGIKFRRQHPLPPYTLDFYSVQLQLAIEIDGSQHINNQQDMTRDKYLANNDIEVLRFFNNDILKNTESVLTAIYQRIEEKLDTSPSPSIPLPKGEGGNKEN